VEVNLVDPPDGNVLGRGAYEGGPAYEFIVASDGHIDFRVQGDPRTVWAGPDSATFRQIVDAWNRYRIEVRKLAGEDAKIRRVVALRQELNDLGGLPTHLPIDPEPLWSLLVFEAENGLS
jgi:hypothetical protein